MPHLRARFFLLIASAVLLCACSSKPDTGYLALQQSREAVREATSWQSDVTVQYPTGQPAIIELAKVDCPGRMDRIGILREPRNKSVHEIWFDGMYYNKTETAGMWLSSATSANPFPNCGKGPSLIWDGILYDDLDAVAATGEIRRGKADDSDGASCLWWEVAPAKGAPPHYSVCVGEIDHLPRLVRSHEHDLNYVYTMSRWNATAITLPFGATVKPN
jgi:hypothetical protein